MPMMTPRVRNPAAAAPIAGSPMAGRLPLNPMLAARRPGGMMKKGGMAHRASERADGCCEKGHTKGTIVACKGGMYK